MRLKKEKKKFKLSGAPYVNGCSSKFHAVTFFKEEGFFCKRNIVCLCF